MGDVPSPREVTYKVTFHQWFTSGVKAIRTLPTICVHRCSVSQVSLQADRGRSGQGDDAFMLISVRSRAVRMAKSGRPSAARIQPTRRNLSPRFQRLATLNPCLWSAVRSRASDGPGTIRNVAGSGPFPRYGAHPPGAGRGARRLSRLL